jgi:hypothetical protein
MWGDDEDPEKDANPAKRTAPQVSRKAKHVKVGAHAKQAQEIVMKVLDGKTIGEALSSEGVDDGDIYA